VKHSAGSECVMTSPGGLERVGSGARCATILKSGVGVGMARVRDLRCAMDILRVVSSWVEAVLRVSLLV